MPIVPMFPLGSVLLPDLPLPLRVFEPRYLKMLGDLLEEDEPEFGVVLIERGQEVGGGDERFHVGTLARVVACEALKDCMVVVGLGTRRFTVLDWLSDDPYPRADIELLGPLEWQESDASLLQQTERQVRAAAELAEQPVGTDFTFSEDPVVACWQLAALAPLGDLDRTELLRSTTGGEVLSRVLAETEENLELMRLMGSQSDGGDVQGES